MTKSFRFSLVASIFTEDRIYAFPNAGGWYDFGYFIGAGAFLGGRRPPNADVQVRASLCRFFRTITSYFLLHVLRSTIWYRSWFPASRVCRKRR